MRLILAAETAGLPEVGESLAAIAVSHYAAIADGKKKLTDDFEKVRSTVQGVLGKPWLKGSSGTSVSMGIGERCDRG